MDTAEASQLAARVAAVRAHTLALAAPLSPEDQQALRQGLTGAWRNEGLFTPPSLRGSISLPGHNGGANWGNAAVDPFNRRFYVVSREIPVLRRSMRSLAELRKEIDSIDEGMHRLAPLLAGDADHRARAHPETGVREAHAFGDVVVDVGRSTGGPLENVRGARDRRATPEGRLAPFPRWRRGPARSGGRTGR